MDEKNAKIVQVATAPNETIAMMWRDMLRDEGIVAAIQGGGVGYTFGQNILNEQYVLVREDQAERAREILDEVNDGEGEVFWEDEPS